MVPEWVTDDLQRRILEGVIVTLWLTALTTVTATSLGTLLALGRRSPIGLRRRVAATVTEVSRSKPAHEQLIGILRTMQLDDEVQRYELRKAFRLARHIRRTDEIGAASDAADLDDLATLLGQRPRNWQEGDAALEAFIVADHGAHDEHLIELLHRRNLRSHAQLGPSGSAMTTHHAIQRFD